MNSIFTVFMLFLSFQQYMEHLKASDRAKFNIANDTKMKPFVNKCLELCWLMEIQSPPVVFGKLMEQGTQERFDSTTYKPYTKTGAFIDFVVWPPLYLHKQGQLLAKGVAQARGKLPSKDAKPEKGSQASAFPGTAVPVHSTTTNELARSFNVKSSRSNMTDFSKSVSGASGFYDNNFSSMTHETDDNPSD